MTDQRLLDDLIAEEAKQQERERIAALIRKEARLLPVGDLASLDVWAWAERLARAIESNGGAA